MSLSLAERFRRARLNLTRTARPKLKRRRRKPRYGYRPRRKPSRPKR